MVSVPYEITLLSNGFLLFFLPTGFQYLMKLHYSQTNALVFVGFFMFQYLMKLHYSQTPNKRPAIAVKVSVPYEITLLSNMS